MRFALVVLVACRSSGGGDQAALNTEAQVQLNKLSRNLKAYWNGHSAFRAGTTGPLPAVPCCKNASGLCAVTPAWHRDTIWTALDFDVLDPGHFQFAYASDGTTATATAIADLDCDGTPITYTLKVTAQGGVPRAVLDQPPLDAD
jgi:hypothetical protein